MPIRKQHLITVLSALVLSAGLLAPAQKPPAPATQKTGPDYSGMYNFLRDGEFVQVTVEDHGRVTGFVSRYGDTDSDRGVFLDHFFKEGKLDGNRLAFSTETVHGLAYEFRGTIERGDGKNPGDEAYYVLAGTLTENKMDAGNKTSSQPRTVAFKIFPQDLGSDASKK